MNGDKGFVVSALKFRPQTFGEVTGQEHISTALRNAIRRNRMANAYLFCGPRGVGKTSTARILAKAMNCENLQDGDPCNQCVSCVSITGGRCLDVIELDAASNRGIDEVRELRDNVRFPPSMARMKVYIIDEAHQLSRDAFNALLKTLEEPPPHAKFILATTESEKMPDTILSRCQQFRFKPLSLQQIVTNLRRCLETPSGKLIPPDIQEEVLFLIARASEGGMRDAQSLFDQVASLADESLKVEEVEILLGGVRLDTLVQIAKAVQNKDVVACLDLVDHAQNHGQDLGLLVRDLASHFRNLMVAKSAPNKPELTGLPPDQARIVVQQAESFSIEDLLHGMDILFEAERRLRVTNSPRAVCESALVKMAKMPSTVELDILLNRLGKSASPSSPARSQPVPPQLPPALTLIPKSSSSRITGQSLSSDSSRPREKTDTHLEEPEPVPPPSPAKGMKPAPATPKPASVPIQMDDAPEQDVLDTLLDQWMEICHQLTEIDPRIGGTLTDARPRSLENRVLELAIREDLTLNWKNLNTREARALIQQVLLTRIGFAPEIRLIQVPVNEFKDVSQSEKDLPAPPPPRRQSVDDILKSEPLIQQLLDQFDGVITDIRNNPNT